MVQLACLVFNHEKPIKIVATGGLMPTGSIQNHCFK